MRRFVQLLSGLESSSLVEDQVRELTDFFSAVEDKDKLWAIALLSGQRPKRTATAAQLKKWLLDNFDVDEWLFEESLQVVGDLTETISLILPEPDEQSDRGLSYWLGLLHDWVGYNEDDRRIEITNAWEQLASQERFVLNKLITGGFRANVAMKVIAEALAKVYEREQHVLTYRLSDNWTPTDTKFEELVLHENERDGLSKPYRFCKSTPLNHEPDSLGNPADWYAEYRWPGICGQLIFREGEVFIWSNKDELLTQKLSELQALAGVIPDGTVIEGSIVTFKNDKIQPLKELQTRIGKKGVTKKTIADTPAVLIAFDLIEWQGEDIRDQPLSDRREQLEQVVQNTSTQTDVLLLSDLLEFNSWEELSILRGSARNQSSEGLMLKRKTAPYQQTAEQEGWVKWKVEPYRINAVLTYVMRGDGRQPAEYTFGTWHQDELVTICKTRIGLTDEERKEIDQFVKAHTIDKFGPVRQITPERVFQLAFDNLNHSSRHKCGLSLEAPRIQGSLDHEPAENASRLQDLHLMLEEDETN